MKNKSNQLITQLNGEEQLKWVTTIERSNIQREKSL